MAILRCFTCIELRQKPKPESSVALLEQSDEDDNKVDEDEDYDRGDEVGVKRFTKDEINKLKEFSSVPWFGSGEFAMLHLSRFPDSTGVAIRFYEGRNLPIFKHELNILLLLHHDNIVKLRGFCDDQGEGVLVFENVGNETLRDKLSVKSGVLSWKSRMKIAYQLSQAIEYLHEECPQEIIHGDIKPSNVMLDEQLDCKLWNFKSAKMGKKQDGSSSPSRGQFVLDFPGYTDFHYLTTGIALKQHDIYSFGIIILELITGIEAPLLHHRGSVESLAYAMLREEATLLKMLDLRLEEDFDLEEARIMASISTLCLQRSISLRPPASDVVRQMRNSIHSINFNCQKKLEK